MTLDKLPFRFVSLNRPNGHYVAEVDFNGVRGVYYINGCLVYCDQGIPLFCNLESRCLTQEDLDDGIIPNIKSLNRASKRIEEDLKEAILDYVKEIAREERNLRR